MKKVYSLIADGSEECECLIVNDLLKRAGIEVVLVSYNSNKTIKSSHNVVITCDKSIDEVDLVDGDAIFIPGGMPGSINLFHCHKLGEALLDYHKNKKPIAAICAAPSVVLGGLGLLENRKATCYPGFEKGMIGAEYVNKKVVRDEFFITASGLGAALDLGLELIEVLIDKETSKRIKEQIQY